MTHNSKNQQQTYTDRIDRLFKLELNQTSGLATVAKNHLKINNFNKIIRYYNIFIFIFDESFVRSLQIYIICNY